MHVIDRPAHLLFGQGEEFSHMPLRPLPQIQPQRLDEHEMGEMLRHQAAAGLWIAQLLAQALEEPAQGRLIHLLANVDDRRKNAQQNIGVVADQGETATGKEEVSTAIAAGNAATPRGCKDGGGIARRQGQIARKPERPPFGHVAQRPQVVAGDFPQRLQLRRVSATEEPPTRSTFSGLSSIRMHLRSPPPIWIQARFMSYDAIPPRAFAAR
ncbi:hypothetical protein BAU07_10340 [Bordetella flabilis]|uniref:Uncharacterized protein n=1 Tax=Bordetella flabilis TaxID=463014 RepID=A0A193GDT7_9BORD|nr:hypothetical protein BAU07_10340 [Bordetella flabilis]